MNWGWVWLVKGSRSGSEGRREKVAQSSLLSLYNESWLVSTAALGSKGGSGPPVYVDLAYIPNHCSGKTADLDFFRRVRASYYVVSGNDPANGEPSRAVLDALLEGKAQWGENLQVSGMGCQGHSLVKASQEAIVEQSLFIKGLSPFYGQWDHLLDLQMPRSPHFPSLHIFTSGMSCLLPR